MDEIVSLMIRGHKIINGQIKGGLSMLVTCHENLALMHQVLSTPSFIRGIERKRIFRDALDKRHFLDRLGKIL